MSALDNLFRSLRGGSQTALMPFITAGSPDWEFTAELLLALDHNHCHAIELGFPYSDPIADGPIIQQSYNTALQNGISVDGILSGLSGIRSQLTVPIVAMISYSLIHKYGCENFVARSQDSGLVGAIVPDLPWDESLPFMKICQSREFDLVQLITPTTPDSRAVQIAKASMGFVYYVSMTGITGQQTDLPAALTERLQWLGEQTETPVCVGFGIREPAQVRMLSSHAAGLIVGSAVVKRILEISRPQDRPRVMAEIVHFVQQMLAATC